MKKSPLKSKPSYELPTEDSTPRPSLGDYSILLFGEKKIGKTTMTACFPKSYHMMFEPGGKSLRIRANTINRWDEARGYTRSLRKDKHYQTVVVDTTDRAYKLCVKHVCADLGIDHPSDGSYGKGWDACRDEFTDWVYDLLSLGKGVIFISHSTEKEIKKRSGVKYDKIVSTMPKQAHEVLDAVVDIWAHYSYEGKRRILQIRGDEHVTAGHRLTDHFKGLDQIDMGKSPQEAYKNFLDAFNNRYQKVALLKRRKA
jgi:hypothetical protein